MDPFSSKHIFNSGTSGTQLHEGWQHLKLDDDIQSGSFRLAESEDAEAPKLHSEILKLSLDDAALEILDSSEASSSSTSPVLAETAESETLNEAGIDIWRVADLSHKQSKVGLLSWDRFQGHDENNTEVRYVSEAGPSAFDAVMSHAWHTEHQGSLRYARFDQFQRAVLNILVGRGSLIYGWNDVTTSFETQITNFSLSGCSPEIISKLSETLCFCGTSFRKIQTFCNSSRITNPTVFAIQSTLLQILNGIEASVDQEQTASLTLLRLQNISKDHVDLYEILNTLLEICQSSEKQSYILTKTLEYVEGIWSSNEWLRATLSHLADRVLQPSIHDTSQQIGHSPLVSGSGDGEQWILGKLLPQYALTFREINTCLEAVRDDDVQIKTSVNSSIPLKLVTQWLELADVQSQADALEDDSQIIQEIQLSKSTIGITSLAMCSGKLEDFTNPFAINFDVVIEDTSDDHEHNVTNIKSLPGVVLAGLRREKADKEPELSPIQMLEMSIGPVLRARHRTCFYNLMRSLFLKHDLVSHLELLHAFQLMSDGLFALRLSKALFDADQYSGEGRRRTGLTAGLRLEDREVWPPASSELRLVLMDLLTNSPNNGRNHNLLEKISFAIRDLSNEELELCRNVHSIHALDFLRLAYAPPTPVLELIITPSTLDKYDRIFRFLLVLLRMHTLSENLMATIVFHRLNSEPERHYHRFCLELHRFITNFIDYAQNVAIGLPMIDMIRYFSKVRDALKNEDYIRCMALAGSISQLLQKHEDTLDAVLAALLLNDEQAHVYAATCEIFSIGLESVADLTNEARSDFAKPYQKLRRALSDWYILVKKHKNKDGNRTIRVDSLEHLLIKVDYSGFYERTVYS